MAHPKRDYEPVRVAVEGGLPFRDASIQFNVPESSLRCYAKHHLWKVTPDIVKKAKIVLAKRRAVSAVCDETWAARGERHRQKVFSIAEASLKTLKKVRVQNAKDLEIVDKVARRAAGLETADVVNQTLIQVNEAINRGASGEPIEAELIPEPVSEPSELADALPS